MNQAEEEGVAHADYTEIVGLIEKKAGRDLRLS
jgi:hypothetical protein